MGNATVVDSMIHDGLWEIYKTTTWVLPANMSPRSTASRAKRQDQFAPQFPPQGPRLPWRAGYLQSQILPISIPAKKKVSPATAFDHDESVREDATLEHCAR